MDVRRANHRQNSILDLNLREQRSGCSGGVCSGLGRAGHFNGSSTLTADTDSRARTKKEK